MPPKPETPKLVEYSQFLRALQVAIAPAPNDRHGLPAIAGKRFYACSSNFSDESPPPKLGTTTAPLTDEDAKSLRLVLKKHPKELPPLRPEPRFQDAENFLKAYRKLKDRPQWEPVIRCEEDSRLLRERRREVSAEHTKEIEKAIKEGRVQLFNDNHVPQAANNFQIRSFLSVEHAIAYVKSIGRDPKEVLTGLASFDGAEKLSKREGKQPYPDYIKKIAVELLKVPDHAAGARLLGVGISAFRVNAERWQREQDAASHQETNSPLLTDTWPPSGRTVVRDGRKA